MTNQLTAAVFYFMAGLITFFCVFNRLILHMWEGTLKKIVGYSAMGVFMAGPAAAGWFLGWNRWAAVPAGLLAVFLLGELVRVNLRGKYRHNLPPALRNGNKKTGSFFTTEKLAIRRFEIFHPKWTGDPLRIVHVTDLHVDWKPSLSFYRSSFAAAAELNPDLMVLTGDYINKKEAIPRLEQIFRMPCARYGVYAVLGNHEFYTDPDTVTGILEAAGIRPAGGTCIRIETDSGRLNIWGHEYPWGKSADLDAMTARSREINIVLTHTPDNIFQLSQNGADIVFAGHFHGGQWRVPILGSLVIPSAHGRLLDQGHFQIGSTHLLVSAGLGTVWFPTRIRCEPELLVLDLKPARIRDRPVRRRFHETGMPAEGESAVVNLAQSLRSG
ncbi:metallophosphoesterase [bacterium]|nr:metallophosphoesterase [candidate division CSSED10-310 bacterium]